MDSDRLRELAVSDTGFVFDPYSGFTFSVNETGRFILEHLKRGLSAVEVARALGEQFEVLPADDPERDVREFMLMLREHGLLPRAAAPGAP